MKQITAPSELLLKILPPLKKTSGAELKLSSFCEEAEYEGHKLLLNNLTGELLLIDGEADQAYLELHHFLVPADLDELKRCENLRSVLRILSEKEKRGISAYTILPTTDCNARCFYCFEKGCKVITMDENTACDTADLIAGKTSGKARLHWFGGEPLFNDRAIDIICERLAAAGCDYRSDMISNGYLFDAEMIGRAVRLWKLENVQITIDGTEAVYNKRKAYIYKDTNAYEQVMHNISALADAGIAVDIRLNLDLKNKDDLLRLCDELNVRFGGIKKIAAYPRIIYQDAAAEDSAKRKALYSGLEEVKQRLTGYGFYSGGKLPEGLKVNRCMADGTSSLVILPDGGLHSCEHINENIVWGSIYTGETKEQAALKYWRERYPAVEECSACPEYPICIRLTHCTTCRGTCYPEEREEKLLTLRRQMVNAYRKYLNKNGTADEH